MADLRVKKTYYMLFQSFTDLLKEKDFDKITVRELCDRALIRRATFYQHFVDKYDYLAFYIRTIRKELDEKNMPDEIEDVTAYFMRLAKNILEWLNENNLIVRRMLSGTIPSVLMDILTEEALEQYKNHIKASCNITWKKPYSEEIFVTFCVGGLVHVLTQCYLGKKKMTEDEILNNFQMIIDGFLLAESEVEKNKF